MVQFILQRQVYTTVYIMATGQNMKYLLPILIIMSRPGLR